MQRPGLHYLFSLAERFREPDPFAFGDRLTPQLLKYWQAYDRLSKPGRWDEVEWEVMDEQTRIKRQSDALRDLLGSIKPKKKTPRKPRSS